MPVIQRSELVEKIRRAFNLLGKDVGNTISPELVPVVLVEDLTGPTISEGYPRRAIGQSSAGASVGVFSENFIINPTGSTVDLVIDEVWLKRSTAGQLRLYLGDVSALNNLLGTQTKRWNVDCRTQTRPSANVDSRNQAALVTYNRDWIYDCEAGRWLVVPIQATLPPGKYLGVAPTASNLGCDLFGYWTERLRQS